MTGDWTQRARKSQFKKAADFLQELKTPVVSVPGNHDLPLYNFLARLLMPLRNYNKYIRKLALDHFVSEEIVVVGIRTATVRRAVEGRVLSKDIERVNKIFSDAPKGALKILASHHPLYENSQPGKLSPRQRVDTLLEYRPDLVLSGHSHLQAVDLIENQAGHKVLHLSAGSALSDRLRGEVNSFHVLEVDQLQVKLETYLLDESGFQMKQDAEPQRYSFLNSVR